MKKTQLVHEVRAVKNKKELLAITKAQRISEQVLSDVLDFLKTGVTEIEVSDFIKKQFIKYKAPILSFVPIVAFGTGTADIHYVPTKNKLKIGDTIMLDFGTTIDHYCSDMTRTYFWGEPSKEQKDIYLAVEKAMGLAFAALTKGERKCKKVDKVARDFLYKKFGKESFPHTLGHGVGTVIHEWPSFGPKSEDSVQEGYVMTIEPAVYIKDLGGVRIEDMILIT
ncbi:MAG: M24 family metallopeptidase, partial [Candidatus Paceibacterota bacterium]